MNYIPSAAFTGIVLLSIYLCLRNHMRMAALIAWLLRSIIGTRAQSESSSTESTQPIISNINQPTSSATQPLEIRTTAKSNRLKFRGKRSVSGSPKFSTKFSTPIEDILIETLNEEERTEPLAPGQIIEKVNNKRKSTKSKVVKNDHQSTSKSLIGNDQPKLKPVKKAKYNSKNDTLIEPRSSSSSNSSRFTESPDSIKTIKSGKKDQISKQGLAEKRVTEPIKLKGILKNRHSCNNNNKNKEKNIPSQSVLLVPLKPKTEFKVSKKVISGVSYASVVTNTVSDIDDQSKPIKDNIEEFSSIWRQDDFDSNLFSNNLQLDKVKENKEEKRNKLIADKTIGSFDHYFIEDCHTSADKEETIFNQSDTRSVELFANAESDWKRRILIDQVIRGDFTDNLLPFSETAAVSNQPKDNLKSDIVDEKLFDKKEAYVTTNHNKIQQNQSGALVKELETHNESSENDSIKNKCSSINESTERLRTAAETNLEEEIQDLEDQILEKPYLIEESEIVVTDSNQLVKEKKDSPVKLLEKDEDTNEAKRQNYFENVEEVAEYLLSDQLQDLEDQIVEKPFVIEEITITGLSPIKLINSLNKKTEQQIFSKAPTTEFTEAMSQIRILTLNDKEHQDSTVYRIEKSFILQFRLGPTLLGRKIKLYCNYPKEINGKLEEFDRESYQLLNWCQDEGCKNADDTALSAQIVANLSGSFHYYFLYDDGNNSENENAEQQGSGYFLIDPVLKYGQNTEILPLDCIQCQTVLAKHLGPFSTWEKKLIVAKKSGYNAIHFTPIQQLGASNSSYSLREQLKLNPLFEENDRKVTFEDVENLTDKMRKEWKVISICDIVLNHTANESEWIQKHPEVTYNCLNCAYLRPAYLLDAAFNQFALSVKNGDYENLGIPLKITNEDHLNAIRYHFKTNMLDKLNIHELFTIDINKYTEDFQALLRKTPPAACNESVNRDDLRIVQDPEFRRLHSSIDLDLALSVFNIYRLDCFDEETRVKKCTEEFRNLLEKLNESIIGEINNDLNAAIENVIAGIRYTRLQSDGPQFADITIDHPLVYRYFTDYKTPTTIEECEATMYSENGKYLMAHNGWVMNSNPLENFAAYGTKIYFRRELIAWGDSVKLRYGSKPADCPSLWQHMRKYVEQTAKIFDGVRLDNCHSTPLPVAEYLLDCARKIRPDLYVVAELFTNSDLTDNIFVNRLGITSLIREAMSAWDPHEEGRLVYRYGGFPVGSFYQPNIRPLAPMVAHALFLDLTHDNPSPVEKRSVFDLLPSTALVNMACCASGSNRGYDELVPHHIHVVEETRQYTEWSDNDDEKSVERISESSGIIAAKKALNDLHFILGKEGYNQVYVDQIDGDIIAVTRHNPVSHNSYVLVAFTAFSHPDINAENYQRNIKPLRVEGVLDKIVLESCLAYDNEKSGGSKFTKSNHFEKDPKWINGLSDYRVSLKQHIEISESDFFVQVDSGTANVIQLNFKNFKPGSVAVIKVSLPEDMRESIEKVRRLTEEFSAKKDTELKQIIRHLKLADLNRTLYRCGEEERDEGFGFDVYNIPNFGPLVFCGFQGFMSVLANIRSNNDLGHPFCANLRDGNWMIEYIWKRLKLDEGTKDLGQWIEENIKSLYNIPRYLIPCYFDVIVTGIYVHLLEQSYNLMSDFVKNGSTFVKGLSLGSIQFGAYIKSSELPTLSPNLAPPKPPTRKNSKGEIVQACSTLSAGLPFFSVGYMRNWGRDTFVALRGIFILTGRYDDARQHILGYAACLRHGLIPNLLDGGRNCRFNCRDAVWWWLYSIKAYCTEVPNGHNLLSDKVSRIFPTDDSDAQPAGVVDQPLYEVIQESLNTHFQGLIFTERNAGKQIDEQMLKQGFNNQIGIHPETGFVFGGNRWNCGTWMDKMGSSEKAGNKGEPATPRDGSAIELIGLSKAIVSWLSHLHEEGIYPYDGVERVHKNTNEKIKWTFKEWAIKIQENFENKFWIGPESTEFDSKPKLINKHNIYKDTFGSSIDWADYQLRCNFPIAMVTAPEMFDAKHAWAALKNVEKYLLGPLGLKTLDPEDWRYRGDYFNSNDSDDYHTAHGFNYHQGPEWVWPIGFFLRAKLIFAAQNGMLKETLASTKVILSRHFVELQTSPWRGLPELTNSNGSYCTDSCRTQAWSMSCILEVLYDLQQIESKLIN